VGDRKSAAGARKIASTRRRQSPPLNGRPDPSSHSSSHGGVRAGGREGHVENPHLRCPWARRGFQSNAYGSVISWYMWIMIAARPSRAAGAGRGSPRTTATLASYSSAPSRPMARDSGVSCPYGRSRAAGPCARQLAVAGPHVGNAHPTAERIHDRFGLVGGIRVVCRPARATICEAAAGGKGSAGEARANDVHCESAGDCCGVDALLAPQPVIVSATRRAPAHEAAATRSRGRRA
jgi:hypothetical protein